jgi:hypothetical protein
VKIARCLFSFETATFKEILGARGRDLAIAGGGEAGQKIS